jgi:hypothetical protein
VTDGLQQVKLSRIVARLHVLVRLCEGPYFASIGVKGYRIL